MNVQRVLLGGFPLGMLCPDVGQHIPGSGGSWRGSRWTWSTPGAAQGIEEGNKEFRAQPIENYNRLWVSLGMELNSLVCSSPKESSVSSLTFNNQATLKLSMREPGHKGCQSFLLENWFPAVFILAGIWEHFSTFEHLFWSTGTVKAPAPTKGCAPIVPLLNPSQHCQSIQESPHPCFPEYLSDSWSPTLSPSPIK